MGVPLYVVHIMAAEALEEVKCGTSQRVFFSCVTAAETPAVPSKREDRRAGAAGLQAAETPVPLRPGFGSEGTAACRGHRGPAGCGAFCTSRP